MALICQEVLPSEAKRSHFTDDDDDDLGLDCSSGGVRSLEDPCLLSDDRVVRNALEAAEKRWTGIDPLTSQPELKPHMRKIVADWMLGVTEEQQCQPEVFSLAVDYLDRVLTRVPVAKNQFQLLASVCLFLASKFKESTPLCADKLVVYTDFSTSVEEIMVS